MSVPELVPPGVLGPRSFPPPSAGHYVFTRLPDGRMACADYRDPVVAVMRRISKATALDHVDPAAEDLAEVAGWLDGAVWGAQMPLPFPEVAA